MKSSRICVAVRKRPPGPDDRDVVGCSPTQLIVNEPKIKYDLTPYTEKHNFQFDEVFDEKANNREVYSRAAAPLVEHVFSELQNQQQQQAPSSSCPTATVFCYGQTGTGKSWTLLGNKNEPGVYLCAAHEVFVRAGRQSHLAVFVSFYEIYGRKLFDLLNDRAKLVCREDGDKVIQICGLTEHPVGRVEQMVGIIEAGHQQRSAGQTSANAESSRSHAVLTMEIRDMRDQRAVGKLAFIDLAGNERGTDTFDCDRKTRIETAEINKSLLALKECIRSLGMGKTHIPFRGSILTEVLRDSFLGNSRTTMVATISALAQNCEHTLNTLRYTSRVKELGPVGKKKSAAAAAAVAAAVDPWQKKNAAAAASAPTSGDAAGGGDPTSKAMARAAAMAERVALDAAAANSNNSNNNNKPVPKQGRRAVGGAVGGAGGSSGQQQIAAPPVSGKRAAAAAVAPNANKNNNKKKKEAVPLDPVVATIVESHFKNLDEIEAETAENDDEDDDEDSGSESDAAQQQQQQQRQDLGSSFKKVRAVHAHIVSRIRASEESVLQLHRRHIDHKMVMMKSEVQHLQQLDESSSIDDYVDKVDALLVKEMKEIQDMRERLGQIGKYLREEEVLSKTLTPAGKRQRPM